MRNPLSLLAALPFLVGAGFYVEPAAGPGVDGALLQSETELVRLALRNQGQLIAETPSEAELLVRTRLVQLGEQYLLIVEKWQGGICLYVTQLKARQAGELDVVTSRAVEALLAETDVLNTVSVGEITEQEVTRVSRRSETRNYVVVGFGPSGLWGLDAHSLSYFFRLGYTWEVADFAALNARTDHVVNFVDGAFLSSGTLGGSLFFTKTNHAPYVGLGMGFGLAGGDGSLHHGFVGSGSAGLLLFRTAAVQLALEVSYELMIDARTDQFPSKAAFTVNLQF